MPVFVITGANRGLGLGYVNELSRDIGNIVFALTRKPQAATDLDDIASRGPARIHVVGCDVSDADSIARLSGTIQELLPKGVMINVVVNNAAVLQDSHLKSTTLTEESLSKHLTANVLGPARTMAALLPLLADNAVVANVSSGLGSNQMLFDERITAQNIPYSLSKAALNMLTVHQAKELKGKAVVVALDPGHVKTAMGGEAATMEVTTSNRAVLQTLKQLKGDDSGKFILYDGTVLPW